MVYLFEAVDNFFFRSPVPFEAGGETVASEGIFPPLPSVYSGVFRTFLEDNSKHKLKIKLNGLWFDNKYYFPMPSDLYFYGKEENGNYFLKIKDLLEKPLSNYPLDYMLHITDNSNKKMKEQKNIYIAQESLMSYLNADFQEIKGINMNENFNWQRKVGIEIDYKSGTSKEGQLYQADYIQPNKKLKLAAEATGITIEGEKIVKIGGEGKLAKLSIKDYNYNLDIILKDSKYFKLYLATPAIFRNGWLPSWIDEDSKIGYLHDKKREIEVKLISACVGRGVPCGGFGYDKEDKQYKPRKLQYAVPAGSVYYFEILQGSFEKAVKLFHKKNISEYRETMGFDYQVFNRSRYCDRGFGYTFVGKLNKKQEEKIKCMMIQL